MGINVEAQKKYWQAGAVSDLETAEILIDKRKLLEGLFFCHLAIEKAIKAMVVEVIQNVPPKTHNLLRLAELANILLDQERAEFLGEMMMFHLEGRYPDDLRELPEPQLCQQYVIQTKETVKWLAELS